MKLPVNGSKEALSKRLLVIKPFSTGKEQDFPFCIETASGRDGTNDFEPQVDYGGATLFWGKM